MVRATAGARRPRRRRRLRAARAAVRANGPEAKGSRPGGQGLRFELGVSREQARPRPRPIPRARRSRRSRRGGRPARRAAAGSRAGRRCRAAWRGRSAGCARHRRSGCRARVPRPLQGASRSTPANGGAEGRPQAVRRHAGARWSLPSGAPAVAIDAQAPAARASAAVTVPSAPARSAISSALPPGAAQASSLRPGPGGQTGHELRALVLQIEDALLVQDRPVVPPVARQAPGTSPGSARDARGLEARRGVAPCAGSGETSTGGRLEQDARARHRRGPAEPRHPALGQPGRQRSRRGEPAQRVGPGSGGAGAPSRARRRRTALTKPAARGSRARTRSTVSETAARSGTRRFRIWWAPRRSASRTAGVDTRRAAGRGRTRGRSRGPRADAGCRAPARGGRRARGSRGPGASGWASRSARVARSSLERAQHAGRRGTGPAVGTSVEPGARREPRALGEGGGRHGPAALRLHLQQAELRARRAGHHGTRRRTGVTVPGAAVGSRARPRPGRAGP